MLPAGALGRARSPGEACTGTVVDVHCHTFNAADLPVRGFLQRVHFDDRRLGGYLAALIERVVQEGAPGFFEESARLDALFRPSPVRREFLRSRPAVSEEEVEYLLAELAQTDPELVRGLQETMPASQPGPDPEQRFIDLFDPGALPRAIRWAKLLQGFRVEVAAALVRTFGDNVDLFAPMLVDLSVGLDDNEKTPPRDQVVLHEKVSRLSMRGLLPGADRARLHPFVGFDPRRELRARGIPEIESPLEVVSTAVQRYGFVGVKLYPPMGFRPLGNDGASDGISLGEWDGAAVDGVMRELFTWCVAEQVPVTAHGNRSNGARNEYDGFSHPDFWAQVLEEFPSLHLNLGHFGGDRTEHADGSPNDWPERIARLAGKYDHVYADVGHHHVDRPKSLKAYLERVRELFAQPGTAAMGDRLLYGSDWLMLALQPEHEQYRETYAAAYAGTFGDKATAEFLGERALRFLGFDDLENKNARRLADRYQRYAPDRRPAWLKASPHEAPVPAPAG